MPSIDQPINPDWINALSLQVSEASPSITELVSKISDVARALAEQSTSLPHSGAAVERLAGTIATESLRLCLNASAMAAAAADLAEAASHGKQNQSEVVPADLCVICFINRSSTVSLPSEGIHSTSTCRNLPSRQRRDKDFAHHSDRIHSLKERR